MSIFQDEIAVIHSTKKLFDYLHAMCIQGGNPHEQLISAFSVTVHEKYPGRYSPEIGRDVAIIRLRKPLEFNDYVQPICIPNTRAAAGTKCFATGWGYTRGTLN